MGERWPISLTPHTDGNDFQVPPLNTLKKMPMTLSSDHNLPHHTHYSHTHKFTIFASPLSSTSPLSSLLSPHTMLDLQQGLPGNRLYSFNPVYQRNSSHGDSMRIIDFDFWDSRQNTSYENLHDDLGSDEIEFQAHTIEDGFGNYSPPLWKTSRGIKNEVYPLLPHNHRCYDLSPRSRKQEIARGRVELMEMIQNMPESSYELSLKDIVDQEGLQEVKKQETIIEDKWFDFNSEVKIKHMKKKKKKCTKKGPITRIESMDSGTFLLKMFFPSCLLVNTKSSTVNRSKVSARTTFEEPEKHVHKEWWKKRFSFKGENKTSGRNGSVGSTSSSSSSSNSNRSRHADSDFLPGCWPAFHTRKSKTRRESGCLC